MIVKGAKRLIITLAVIAILLVLWAMQLPQYGDSAIGTVMVLMASFAAYILMLALAVPMTIRSLRRRETLGEAAWLCASIVSPIVGWAIAALWSSVI